MKSYKGFTLIELLVAVLIVGILARIAFPYYLDATLKGGRSDARIALNEVAQRMQRCYTSISTYAPTTSGRCVIYDTITGSAGFVSENGFYVVKREDAAHITANTFILTATPVATKRQSKDKTCAKLTLDQRGVRTAKDSSNNLTDKCW